MALKGALCVVNSDYYYLLMFLMQNTAGRETSDDTFTLIKHCDKTLRVFAISKT